MRDAGAWIGHLVPRPERDRIFEPALEDARRERRVRRRRTRGLSRTAVDVLFVWRVLTAAVECRALARAARRPFDHPRPRFSIINVQDMTFALRMLRKAPEFTITAVLALALGIGANTAIFTVVEQVLLRPLPYPDAGRIVTVDELMRGSPSSVSPPNFRDWRQKSRTLASLGGFNEQTLTLSGGAEALRLTGVAIDEQVLPALGVRPARGRAFGEGDMRPGARPVALLGSDVWRRVYGADAGIVGRSITLEGQSYEVVGVMPPSFDFPDGSEVWVPLALTPAALADDQRGAHYISAVGRLRPGVTATQATQDLDAIEQDIARRFPTRVGGYTVAAVPLLESMTQAYQRPLWILFGAVGFVMLIACVNISNLLLARATTRTGEIAVRAALGAGRGRLVRQLLAESVVLSLIGGAAGITLGTWGVRALMAIAPSDLPRAADVQMNAGVIAFSVLLSLIAGILFGVAPAVVASRPDLAVFLRDARRDGRSTGGRRRLRAALVGAQVALALILLAGAGLAARSFTRLVRVDPGFRTDSVLTYEIVLPQATYPSLASQTGFFRDYLERVQHEPGILAAGAISFAPLAPQEFGGSFTIYDRPDAANVGGAQVRAVTPGYMDTVRIPLREGRFFDAHDTAASARVAIVSEAAARRYWPGENPVGKRIRVHVNEATRAPREIVGVVGDVHARGLDVAPKPMVYVPHAQYGPETMTVMVRTRDNPMRAVPTMKALLRTVDPGVAMGTVRTLDQIVAASAGQPRFRAVLLLVFGVASLALAAVGVYGVVAFSVNQRRNELGLRMALGADPAGVLSLVLRDGMRPVAVGIAAGLIGAAVLSRVMQTLLFETDAVDPLTFGGVAAILSVVALAACYIPARRATRLDPAMTLR